mgnify:CR=1 FL=1
MQTIIEWQMWLATNLLSFAYMFALVVCVVVGVGVLIGRIRDGNTRRFDK